MLASVPDLTQLIEAVGPSIVQVVITTMENNSVIPYSILPFEQFTASAFFVEYLPGSQEIYYLLTNAHELVDARQLYIRYPAGSKTEYPVNVEFICRYRDLALLSIPKLTLDSEIRSLPLVTTPYPLLPGTRVLAIGYPLGEHSLKTSIGIISGYSTNNKDIRPDVGDLDLYLRSSTMYQVTSTLNSGNSGGVLLDFNGRVVGITSGGNTEANNINYSIPIYHYLNLAGAEKEVNVPNLSVVFSKTTPTILAYLKSPRSGVLIREKYPDSTLDEIDAGDIWSGLAWSNKKYLNEASIDNEGIVSLYINGEKFPTTLTLPQIAELIPPNSEILLRRVRNGKYSENKTKYSYRPTSRLSFIYPIFEEYSYFIFAGGCWVQYTLNSYFLLQRNDVKFPATAECRSIDVHRPWIVLSSIFPGTKLERDDIFRRGDVLVAVNEKEINSIEEFRQIVQSPQISLRTLHGKLEVISREEARNDDRKISYHYR